MAGVRCTMIYAEGETCHEALFNPTDTVRDLKVAARNRFQDTLGVVIDMSAVKILPGRSHDDKLLSDFAEPPIVIVFPGSDATSGKMSSPILAKLLQALMDKKNSLLSNLELKDKLGKATAAEQLAKTLMMKALRRTKVDVDDEPTNEHPKNVDQLPAASLSAASLSAASLSTASLSAASLSAASLSAANKRLNTKVDELTASNKELTKSNRQLIKQVDELTTSNRKLTKKVNELTTSNKEVLKSNRELLKLNGELTSDVERLNRAMKPLLRTHYNIAIRVLLDDARNHLAFKARGCDWKTLKRAVDFDRAVEIIEEVAEQVFPGKGTKYAQLLCKSNKVREKGNSGAHDATLFDIQTSILDYKNGATKDKLVALFNMAYPGRILGQLTEEDSEDEEDDEDDEEES